MPASTSSPPTTADRLQARPGAIRALWPALLLLAGPLAGVAIIALVFGLPGPLRWLLGAVLAFDLALFSLLLPRPASRRAPPPG